MELSQKFDAKRIELRVRGYLAETDVASDLLESAKDREKARFIEGPPTMNGPPHVGHLRGRIIKDLWYRFSTLRGAYVEFNAGWDTQGLPIELQAEKELGVTGGKAEAIERFGIERIVAECKKIVAKNTTEWEEADRQLGISLDHDKAYRTFDDKFIEREWKIIKSAKESRRHKGGLYRNRILPELPDVAEPRRGRAGIQGGGGPLAVLYSRTGGGGRRRRRRPRPSGGVDHHAFYAAD